MALRPALRASAAGCSACRTSLLHLFVSPLILNPTVHALSSRRASRSATIALSRSFSARHARLYTAQQPPDAEDVKSEMAEATTEADREATGRQGRTQEHEQDHEQEDQDQEQDQEQEQEQRNQEEQPWYLQEEPPRHPTLIPSVQPLPEVPKNTPALLGDVVKYVAEDMGLDDLNLMDLRTLDPPPALGPSLVMLFGTARSERHLHVSAGNLKSWLRNRGIKAHADGLLGRNEFRIKMRRRHRKAKMLGTSATALGGDDGISTGWICVNLGTIGSAENKEMAFETPDGKYAGFGVRQTGLTTIVVQMMTETRRKDLDLETLWARILARRGDNSLVEDDLEYVEADTHPNEISIFTEGGSPKAFTAPAQRRFFSTSCRSLSPPGQSTQVTDPPTRSPNADNVDKLLDPVRSVNAKIAELEQLQARYASFSPIEAADALVHLEDGHRSVFLREWNDAINFLPSEQSWRFRLWLIVAGRNLGLQKFALGTLHDLVQEMELLGIMCHRGHYLELLKAVYLEPIDSETTLDEQSELALDILNIMFERGEGIVTTDVVVSLIESLARAQCQGEQQRALQAVLEKFLLQTDLPYMGEDLIIRLLDAYAVQDNWDRWWDVWRMPPRHLQPRSKNMYIHLWSTMAATNHQRRCREAIRQCFDEMLNEDPPVKPVGVVRGTLEACIRIADPAAEEIAKQTVVVDRKTERIARHEFVYMLRQLNPQWRINKS